jgi:hypothetical protein
MNEIEAKQFLADRGPWNIQINDDEFVFENAAGDVVTVDIFVDAPFVGVPGVIVKEFTKGVRL